MQVSITGATGFIGRRLVQYYEERGAVVHILTRENYPVSKESTKLFQHDLVSCSSSDLIEFVNGSDIIYHCAAELLNVSKMLEVNVEGTKKLFRAARGRVGRWVQLSSVGVYGRARFGCVDESYFLAPQNNYEKSKLAADDWLIENSQQYEMKVTILRPSTVFAEDMPNQSLFQLFNLVKRGLFFYIGSKQAQMNYVHIDNVLAALILCGHHANAVGETFIVSDHLRVDEFIGIISDQFERGRPWLVIPEWIARGFAATFSDIPYFPLTASRIDALTSQCIFVDDHIRKKLGYLPAVLLREGLQRFACSMAEGLGDGFARPN